MTFGESINLKDYLAKESLAPLNQANIDTAALKLTTHLTLQQEYASPVVLNMMVAAILLQQSTATIQFEQLFASCRQLYDYMVKRGGIKMIMTQPPSRFALLDCVKKLGFQVTELANKNSKSRIKKYDINLDAKRDQKTLLGLSYYSNNLLQNLVMDTCVGKLVTRHMFINGHQTYEVKDLIETAHFMQNILRNEYL